MAAGFIDTGMMTAIAYLFLFLFVICVLAVCAIFGLAAYNRRWMPIRGVKDEGFFTALLEHKDGTYEPITGEFFEATHLYLNRERELEDKQNQMVTLTNRILELTNEDGSANADIADAETQLQILIPLRISLYQNWNVFLCDSVILHITRSMSGIIYFLVQHKNLEPLSSYATISRRAGLEWVWQVLGLRSRRLLKCWGDDVPKAQVQNLRRYSDLPTKGMWKWIRPYSGEKPTAADREPPPNMLIQLIAQESKVSRMMNEVPTMQRQMKDLEGVMGRKDQLILDKSMENMDIREGFADMGLFGLGPKHEAFTTTFVAVAALLVGGAVFFGLRLGQEVGGVLGAVFSLMGVVVLYNSGRLNRLK